jgi:hypothetical protein
MLRFVSILLAMAVVVLAWLITRQVFPSQPQFWLAIPAFIVFLPMWTHVSASLGTDGFATLLASGLLFLFISFFDRGVSKSKISLAIVLLILPFFIKRSVIFVYPWAGLAAILYLGYRKSWAWKRFLFFGLVCAIILGGILGWMALNPAVMARLNISALNLDFNRTPYSIQLIEQGYSLQAIAKVHAQLVMFTVITFWGNFGFATINIPWPWAWGLMVLCAILLIGTFIFFVNVFRQPEQTSRFQRYVLILFLIGLVIAVGSAFFPALMIGPRWGPQARYYFPVLIPIATFFYLGAWQLCPANYRHTYLLPMWLVGLVGYDLLVISQVILPFLYA